MSSNPYRKDFPLLENNKVIYLDNAATSQRPEAVIQAEAQFYEKYNANPLRGLYELSVEATDCYEEARETVRKFIGAGSTEEIIFTRNTTEGLNLVAYSYGFSHLKAGDEVLVSIMEHHSNLLPWQPPPDRERPRRDRSSEAPSSRRPAEPTRRLHPSEARRVQSAEWP